MSKDLLHKLLTDKLSGTYVPDFLLCDEVTSTNDILKDIICKTNDSGIGQDIINNYHNNISEGFSVIALSQSKGKGRSGRSFFSPPDCSVYFSLYLKPDRSIAELGVLTPLAASAVYDSIKEVCGIDCGIKWVNDIFVNDKKVCGILTETSLSTDSDVPKYIVIGIGLNVFCPQCKIPDEISDIYGTIYDKNVRYSEKVIAKLVSLIINKLMEYYYDFDNKSFLKSYRKGLFIVGSEVNYISGDSISTIIVDGVDDEVNLLAHDVYGNKYKFRDGEIRLKLLLK